MTLRSSVKRLGERLTDTHIFRVLPRGVDLAEDVRRFLPAFQAQVIFDIGANVGQSAQAYLRAYPEARIHCFEPVPSTYEVLVEAVRGEPRVQTHRLALAASNGVGHMALQGSHDMHYLLKADAEDLADPTMKTEVAAVTTLDEICRQQHIENINFAKIDTEGGDLDVLLGGGDMLSRQRIDLVQVEAGMNPENQRHVPLERLKSLLETHGYRLFGLYEQVGEWPAKQSHLRRTNAVFASRRTIDANTPPVRGDRS